MSYCRFAWDGSDVYVFGSGDGVIECCGCSLKGDLGRFASKTAKEMKNNLKLFGKLTLIQALKSTGYVCIIVFIINVLVAMMINWMNINALGSNLISNIISWLWFGLFAIFESRKLENLNSGSGRVIR